MTGPERRIREEIDRQLSERKPGRTICPSDVARALAEDWRPLMPQVRRIASEMASEGRLSVTQKGRAVDAEEARGPIRLGRP